MELLLHFDELLLALLVRALFAALFLRLGLEWVVLQKHFLQLKCRVKVDLVALFAARREGGMGIRSK